MLDGADFYDNAEMFNLYMNRRQNPNNPNDTIEKPIFMALLGDVRDKAVLDLGCGDGAFGVELLNAGCRSYTGIEASHNMATLAEKHLQSVGGQVVTTTIEDWQYPTAAFDVVVSRLAPHYVADIQPVFAQVAATLKPGGRFIFSVIHPVITSCNRGATASGVRLDWIVDDYFVTGKRDVEWMGGHVAQYHRTVEDYFAALQAAGFTIDSLRESRPMPENFTDEALLKRRERIPLFLLFAAHRK